MFLVGVENIYLIIVVSDGKSVSYVGDGQAVFFAIGSQFDAAGGCVSLFLR